MCRDLIECMNKIRNMSSVPITQETKKRLESLGKKNQSYNRLLTEILDFIEKSDQWWVENR